MSHHYSNRHLRNALGHDELRLGCRDHIVRCDTWRRLRQGRATAGESNHCELSYNQIDLSQRGERLLLSNRWPLWPVPLL
jgi:hypothetical protein